MLDSQNIIAVTTLCANNKYTLLYMCMFHVNFIFKFYVVNNIFKLNENAISLKLSFPSATAKEN